MGTVELLEDVGQLGYGDAIASVLDVDADRFASSRDRDLDRLHATRVLHRVGDEIGQYLPRSLLVADSVREALFDVQQEADRVRLGIDFSDSATDEGCNIEGGEIDCRILTMSVCAPMHLSQL